MPDVNEIRVFIASPNDLGPERQRFKETVDDLNKGFADGAGVSFVPMGWEDTLAAFGTRTQSVINQDIDACDVFILVLNRRWGQEAPDSNYSSYTEEEFHRAMQRFESTGNPTIFVFFKRVDQESEADPGEQLKKVMAFRQTLEDTRKVLYRYFDDMDTFAAEIDCHLRAYAKDELPEIDAEADTGVTLLPLDALDELKQARKEAQEAVADAEKSQQSELNIRAQAEELALSLAEDAAEAALDGKLEKARQRFAQALNGTSNVHILYHAYSFYRRTGDLSQSHHILERWVAATQPGSANRAAAYGNLGLLHKTRGDLDEAERMYKQALEINEALGRKEGMASNYGNLGNLYRTRGELDAAEKMYKQSLEIEEALGRKEGMASDYCNLGLLYKTRGELDDAERMYKKAMEINEALGRAEGMALDYGNLGNLYRTRGELKAAERMFEQALEINEALGRKEGMANQYGNLGNLYQSRGELDDAERMYKQSLEIDEALGRKEGLADNYGDLGTLYETRGELDEAERMYKQSLDIEKLLGRKEGMASNYGNLGNLYRTRGDLADAERMYKKALEINEALGSKEGLGISCLNLGDLYLLQLSKDKARMHLTRALSLFEQLKSPHKQETEGLLAKLED